jgi:hypothetical protein
MIHLSSESPQYPISHHRITKYMHVKHSMHLSGLEDKVTLPVLLTADATMEQQWVPWARSHRHYSLE